MSLLTRFILFNEELVLENLKFSDNSLVVQDLSHYADLCFEIFKKIEKLPRPETQADCFGKLSTAVDFLLSKSQLPIDKELNQAPEKKAKTKRNRKVLQGHSLK
ncbi:hypothetical protein GEMRC1_004193 [Eukaryota sp. GEM-RC1]